jgi:hypothetical protein
MNVNANIAAMWYGTDHCKHTPGGVSFTESTPRSFSWNQETSRTESGDASTRCCSFDNVANIASGSDGSI